MGLEPGFHVGNRRKQALRCRRPQWPAALQSGICAALPVEQGSFKRSAVPAASGICVTAI
ncbi:hypothetical protein REMIM1_CH00830 [Rhizobium etli bv. mimosae str. Mim1]|nr:hypothetical protein REMIM1_CH00830 [Rhizobium etli bv. mimosae str. Mim1]